MQFADLLRLQRVDPETTIVMRHRPFEPELRDLLPSLAAEQPKLYNAYQQAQGAPLERLMHSLEHRGTVASFIGTAPREAVFVGLFRIGGSRRLSHRGFWRLPENRLLRRLGMQGFRSNDPRTTIRWFSLTQSAFYRHWAGKLVVSWPGPERSWWRRCHRNAFDVRAIHEESRLAAPMPDWRSLNMRWEQLTLMPRSWRETLSNWRGIYYIFDTRTKRGYVGSAYGPDNILGRWQGYARRGHGGNALLRALDPSTFRFSILERLGPDVAIDEVIRVESSWKSRLNTRAPFGLNAN